MSLGVAVTEGKKMIAVGVHLLTMINLKIKIKPIWRVIVVVCTICSLFRLVITFLLQ